MRVLMVSPKISGAFGQERVIRDSTELLRGAGHQVFLLGGDAPLDVPSCDGHEIVREVWDPVGLYHFRRLKGNAEKVLRVVDRFRPDVIHLIDIFDLYLVEAFRKNYPTVSTAHLYSHTCPSSTRLIESDGKFGICDAHGGLACAVRHQKYNCMDSFRNNMVRAHVSFEFVLKQRAQKRLKLILAISDHVRGTLLRDGIPEAMVRTVYNPVKIPSARPTTEKFPENLLVCASRLVQHKGVPNLVRAVAKIKDRPWTLWVMGDGAEKTLCEKLAWDLGVSDRISFFGRVSYERVQEVLFHATSLVQPNLGPEPFGLSAAEALSVGVPVVAAQLPALDEIVQNEKTGLLYPPNDVDSLAHALARLLDDRVLRARLSEAGPESIRTRFSPEEHLRRTLDAYRFAASGETASTVDSPSRARVQV